MGSIFLCFLIIIRTFKSFIMRADVFHDKANEEPY